MNAAFMSYEWAPPGQRARYHKSREPASTSEELVAAVGRQFHRDYAVVLRAVLFAVDRHRARQVTGLATETARTAQ
jgi:hypothetical protein